MNTTVKFEEVAELRKEQVQPVNFQDSKYIGLEHISQGTLELIGFGYGRDVDSQKQRFYKGDILFGKLRPYFRKVIIAPFDGICSTDIWVVKAKSPSDANFIKYWMASKEFVDSSTHASEGSRMPRAQWDWVSAFESPIVSPDQRELIGNKLADLDAAINVNKELVGILEGIALAIFKDWFIDYSPVKSKMGGVPSDSCDLESLGLFPDSFEDTSYGYIPKGWQVSPISKILSLQGGYAFKSTDWQVSGVPVVKIGSVKPGLVDFSQGSFVSDSLANKVPEKFWLPEGSLVVGLSGYVGEVGLVPKADTIPLLNQRVAKFELVDSEWKIPFTYCLTRQKRFKDEVVAAATGSAQANVSNAEILSIVRPIPPKALIEKFNVVCEPIFEEILTLHEGSSNLAKLRDKLLTKLISGDLRLTEQSKELADV